MLGKYLARVEDAAWAQCAERDHTLPFAEQVRQHALIMHWHGALSIRDDETHANPHAVVYTFFLDQTADAEGNAYRHVLVDDIARTVKIEHIIPQCRDNKRSGAPACDEQCDGKRKSAAFFWCHNQSNFVAP